MNEMNEILTRWAGKLADLLAHSYGRLITLVGFTLGFIAPVKYAFVAMGVAVVGDLLFRVMSLLKLRRSILSERLRETPVKVIVYFGFMVVVFVTERIFVAENFVVTKTGCVLACVCEIWSMLGSVLIIWPDMLFPRLLKKQLRGEVEAKIGKDIANQLDTYGKETDKQTGKQTEGNPQ